MTLHTFIETIQTAGDIPGSLESIAIELYRCSRMNCSDSTISAAVYGKRSQKYNGPLNELEFIRYFEERTISTWPKMQEAFGKLDEYGLIDRDTKDRNVFYESLLVQFYDIIRLVPVSLLDILPQKPLVFGREIELKQLDDIFETSNYAILTGIGGIGKSCVALVYAHALKKSGNWTVQHIICENDDTLQTAILKLQFNGLTDTPKDKKNADKENLNRRIDSLKNSAKHILIVLDNLNWPFTVEDFDTFERLTKCGNHVRILITSRNTLTNDKQCMVHLVPLNDDALLEFYAYHRFEDSNGHKDYIAQHQDILIKLFLMVEKHTLMIEILAKLPRRLFVDEYTIYDRLSNSLRIPLEGIGIKKDGEIIEIPLEGLVKVLFDSSNLTDSEKTVMRYMSIMPVHGIDIKLFEELTHYSRRVILTLKNSHWIILDEEKLTIRLHPLICEAILSFNDTKPTEENCVELLNCVKKKLNMFEEGSPTWFTLSKIMGCYAENVHFREIAKGLDYLKDEYKELILFINKDYLAYINSDSIEEYLAKRKELFGDDDDNGEDSNVDADDNNANGDGENGTF